MTGETAAPENSRRWLALLAVALATFMTYLDNNVVNVALPSIQRDLDLTISGLEWIASGYILVFAGLLLVGGRIADVFGRRGVFFTGLTVFTLASLAAGLAGDQSTLLAARAVQGVGAALLTPTALALLPDLFPDPRERGVAVGLWGGVGALALAVGPLAGGYLSQHVSWGWIFLINVPIGAVAALVAALSLPRGGRAPAAATDRTADRGSAGGAGPAGGDPDGVAAAAGGRAARWLRGRRLDLPGLVTSSVALFALTYALIEGESHGWTSAGILAAFAVAAFAGGAFLAVETRAREAMVDLSFFRIRAFGGGLAAIGLWAFGVLGVYFYTAIYLQNVLGFSPTGAGAGFVPMALVMAVVAALAPRLEARFGAGPTVAAGLALMALAIGMLATVGAGSGYLDLLPWFLLFGVGGGLLIPLTNVIIGVLPPARAGLASGMLNVSREVFGLLGITVLGAIVNARRHAAGGTDLHRFLAGYQSALVVGALLIAVGVPISLATLRRTTAPGPAATAAPTPAGDTAPLPGETGPTVPNSA